MPPEGTVQMLLLASFVSKHQPDSNEGDWLTRAKKQMPSDGEVQGTSRLATFLQQHRMLEENGHVPDAVLLPVQLRHPKLAHSLGSVLIGIMAIVFAPIAGIAAFGAGAEKDQHESFTPIVSPVERGYRLTQFVGLFAAILLWVAAATYLMNGRARLVAMGLLSAPALGLMVACVRTIALQREWKQYWSRQLTRILQRATSANDHDLFMRAAHFQTLIDRETVIPLSEIQRVVLIVAAIVQILLIGVVPVAQALWSHNPSFK